jgi:predicted RNA polymerase sigma factor
MTSRSDRSSAWPDRAVEEAFRSEWGRLLSLLVARTRRLDLAEDALGEAFARASERWTGEGVPANPGGWLYATAFRHVVGRLRAEATAGRKAPLLAVRPGWVPPPDPTAEELPDDRLHLVLLCCHPALPAQSRSALALRLVIGTPTEQIARLFLVPQATMAARLTRAKRKIVLAGIPLGAPVEDELRTRLDEVCRTIYLAFTAGYTPGAGPELLRADLAGDAVRLATVLHDLVPDATQVRALLALLVLQHSRRDARQRDGRLVTLADQDRSMWHHAEIQAGANRVRDRAPQPRRRRRRGPGAPRPPSPSSRASRGCLAATTESPPSAPTSPNAPATSTSPGPRTAPRSTSARTMSNGPTCAPGSMR